MKCPRNNRTDIVRSPFYEVPRTGGQDYGGGGVSVRGWGEHGVTAWWAKSFRSS